VCSSDLSFQNIEVVGLYMCLTRSVRVIMTQY
jgi:hypothetical protein